MYLQQNRDYKKRRSNRTFGMLVCLLLVVSACVVGFALSRGNSRQQAEGNTGTEPLATVSPQETQGVQNVMTSADTLSADCVVEMQCTYEKCGHVKTYGIESSEVEGFTKDQLAVQYPECEVTEFGPLGATLTCSVDGYCPDHYVLKRSGDKLCIYQPQDRTGELIIYKEIEGMNASDLGIEELEQGILFDDIEQIESYLEEIES